MSRGGLYVWPWLSRRRAVSLCTARPPDTLRRLHSQRVIITHLVRAVKLQHVSSYASTAVSSPSVAHGASRSTRCEGCGWCKQEHSMPARASIASPRSRGESTSRSLPRVDGASRSTRCEGCVRVGDDARGEKNVSAHSPSRMGRSRAW